MNNEAQGDNAFKISEEIKTNENYRRALMIKNTQLLETMLDKELYKLVLGDEQADWSAYLGQIETFYTRSQINRLIRIYKKYTKQLELDPQEYFDVPASRLQMLIPIITSDNAKEWLSAARTLLRRDFDVLLRKEKGLPTLDDCAEHKFVVHETCSICGFKKIKTENESVQ